jgi:hypothetical protein
VIEKAGDLVRKRLEQVLLYILEGRKLSFFGCSARAFRINIKTACPTVVPDIQRCLRPEKSCVFSRRLEGDPAV